MTYAVTVAVIGYNQQSYVREAIKSAFAQQFSPLEIILSDDCSTDDTFAIMEAMAAAYDGSHIVSARREPSNVGTVRHLINIARAAQGELLIIAAADDISYPDRAQALHDAWKTSGASALASWHDEMNERGEIIRRDVSFPPSAITQLIFRHEARVQRVDGVIPSVPGFCAAYPRSFWAELPAPEHALFVEDGIAGALIHVRGDLIQRVPKTLLAYRLHEESSTVRAFGIGFDDLQRRERKIDQRANALVHEMDYTIGQIRREKLAIHPNTMKWFDRARNHGKLLANFWATGPVGRFSRIAKIRTRYDASFVLPRLLGMRAFATLRRWMKR